ncbi:alpha-amylase family glycosyl hydrolase [Streptomyces sp. NPDC054863]
MTPAQSLPRSPMGDPWWRQAVCYQVYVRAFADGDGDGIGDLPGLRSRLEHIARLGVDAVWLTPFHPSPLADAGYDITDHTAVAPELGTLDDWTALAARAHELGLRVLVDLVPNHTSVAHPWFRALLAAPPGPDGDAARARYVVRAGSGANGEHPPNDWLSAFGGPAWSRLPQAPGGGPALWYLHLHTPDQPDLNWRHPQVRAEFERILRFWAARGADGFRIDVAHTLVKADGLPDAGRGQHSEPWRNHLMPYHDQPELQELYARWREVVDTAPGPDGRPPQGGRLLVGEAILFDHARLARYVRPGRLGQVFDFTWTEAPWNAAAMREAIEGSTAATAAVGAWSTWTSASHDTVRSATRYADGDHGDRDGAAGLRRARAAALVTLALPGAAYVYQGEELGLPQAWVPEDGRRDPVWHASGGADEGRDGCRVPLPWAGTRPPYGFSTAGPGRLWFPQPGNWAPYTVSSQEADPLSTLALYRAALMLRRAHPSPGPAPVRVEGPGSGAWLAFDRAPGLRCVVNFGPDPLRLDPEDHVLLSSGPLDAGALPRDTAAWLTPVNRGHSDAI